VPFFFAFFSKLSNRLINSFSFLSCSWFIIYSSKQNLHTSLCDNLPSLIFPFFGWFTIQSLYVATITLAYYHLKTLRYLFLMWFSLGLIEYRLLQHGHLFLYGPVPCLNGIHSMHVLQYPWVRYGIEYLPRCGFGYLCNLQFPLQVIPIICSLPY